MNIHEYQAKSLLQRYGVAVPRGGVVYTPQEAESVAKSLGGAVWVVKSQIHAGGRGAYTDGRGRRSDNVSPILQPDRLESVVDRADSARRPF